MVLSAVLLTACGSGQNSASPTRSSPAVSSMRASPVATAAPVATKTPPLTSTPPAAQVRFRSGDVVGVTAVGNGLAVRVAPATTAATLVPLVRSDPLSVWRQSAPELRLKKGYAIEIVIGPLCLEEFCWYRISDLFQPSSTTDGSLTSWGTPLGSPTDTGWAAASGPDGPYLEPVTYDKGIQIVGDSYSGDSSTVIDSFKIGPDVEIDGWWALATDDWAP